MAKEKEKKESAPKKKADKKPIDAQKLLDNAPNAVVRRQLAQELKQKGLLD